MQAVKIPDLEQIHKPYTEAAKRARDLGKRLDDLTRDGHEAARDGYGSYPSGLIARVRELQRDVGDADATAEAEQRAASSLAKDMILGDPAYRRALAGAVEALIARFEPLFSYSTVVHDAGTAGIKLPPLPFTVLEDIRELKLWIASLYKLDLLGDLTQLPLELRPEPRPTVEVLS